MGLEDEFIHACEVASPVRLSSIDPQTPWIDWPDHVSHEPGEVVVSASVRNSGWEVFFQISGTEVAAVWTWFGAACPFVVVRWFTKGQVRWLERGEILRNLRGAQAEARQSVTVPITQRALTVRIEERKNEVTYLDDVYVELGGRRLRPVNCPRAPYCRDDEIYARIEPGEFVVLDFDVPESWVGRDAVLFAEGHYRVRAEPPPPSLLDMNENGWPR